MGQTLSQPDTKKKSDSGGSDRLLYAVSEMQGWRIGMEDSHAAVLDLDGASDSNAFFAVYDGHGGPWTSKYAGENLHKRLTGEEAYQEKRYDAALKTAFLGTDEDLRKTRAIEASGATAVAALVTADNKIYVANAGDSRSVIAVKGEVKPLSFDHKPTNDGEKARISAAGGYVDYGRVNGNLALSRALGDFEFKSNTSLGPEQQIITADPEITCHDISEEDEFLVLACDGIWDCLTSQQVVDIIRYQVSEGKELGEITEMMCDHCIAPDTTSRLGIGCDNMTILIVAFLHGRTKEEWYSWITDRVKNRIGYETPDSLPQLYSPSRLKAFHERQEALEAAEKRRQESADPLDRQHTPLALGLARLLSSHGVGCTLTSFKTADEEGNMDSYRFDSKNPDAQTNESEHDMDDGETDFDEAGEATSPNRDLKSSVTPVEQLPSQPDEGGPASSSVAPVEQLPSQPSGDAPASVAKIEGSLESSEDPFKI